MPRQTDLKTIHVIALALENHQGEILIAKRANDKHQGNLWEFPGGKREANETSLSALKREIREELDYTLVNATPLKCITHKYSDCIIKLDVWHALDNNPQVRANENQPLKWVSKSQLKNTKMPAANQPIIEALLDSNQF
jgi:8-oxo-dGTP diphosphatase